MNINVSFGEAIDKYSILELKLKKIIDPNKLIEIQNEINILYLCLQYKNKYKFYYNLLMHVNEKIWDTTDIIKTIKLDNPQFSVLSNDVFEFNQKRFRIKNWFNLLVKSNIKEQKSYATTHCKIVINNEDTFYNKIAEINYLSLDYDIVSFEAPALLTTIKKIFNLPTFIYEDSDINKLPTPTIINIEDVNITEKTNRAIFEFTPIIYINGGMFGDFIQSLSVINEKFYETGRKGNLFIGNKGDKFRNGIENTYTDTYQTIIKQKYINEYKIHNNELYDIDLTIWRNSPNLCKFNWYELYKDTYNVEWGKHVWLDSTLDEKWNDIILINTTHYRWTNTIDYTLLKKKFLKLVFISSDINEYNFFITNTKLHIPFYKFTNFSDLCIAINSCKLFVGSFSAPLSIAHAFNKNRIIGKCDCLFDIIKNSKLNIIWDNIRYEV